MSLAPEPQSAKLRHRSTRKLRLFEPALVRMATVQSFKMLEPHNMLRNPVMFLVEVGTVLTAIVTIQSIAQGSPLGLIVYQAALTFLLLITVLFANFAEALAEARGKAPADSLRATRADTPAYKLRDPDDTNGEVIASTKLRAGDYVVITAGQVIPTDGEVVRGVASEDESAITGESAPVIREAGGDHSGVTGGTRVLPDRIVIEVTAEPGQSFLDKRIALVEGASRQKTPNEFALTMVLAAFSLIFLIVMATLYPMARYFDLMLDIPTLIALLVCLIPTTIGALLAAIGGAGMDRALAANLIAKSGKAGEVAGDIDTLLLDKTGTITIGNRRATQSVPLGGASPRDVARVAGLASMADSRIHRPGHARDEARLHPQGAGGRQTRGHDGRWHLRCLRVGVGRHRRGHELGHAGRQGGRQHGRPRQRPHQAHRGRRDRQAIVDDPWRARDVLHRQRPGEVFRRDPGHVHRHAVGAEGAGRDGPGHARRGVFGHPRGGDLQRDHHPPADPDRAEGRDLSAGGRGALLRRNLLFYGLGGVIAPFIGIKLIDLAIDPLLGLVGIQ